MANPIYIPLLNPIRLMQDGHKYHKPFIESILSFESEACYFQPFNNLDNIRFQIVHEDQLGFTASVIDLDGNVIKSIPVMGDNQVGGMLYTFFRGDFSGIPEGYYLIKVTESTNDIIFYSEPIEIKPLHQNTILIEYTHDQNDFGMYFTDGVSNPVKYYLRVQGGLTNDSFTPGSKSDAFINDDYNVVLLESKPYSTQKLKIGDSKGVPNWVADKINRIFSCSTVRFNGQQWTKTDGAKMEATREDIYPMAGWTIEVIRASNSHYDIAGGGDFNNDFNDDFNNIEP